MSTTIFLSLGSNLGDRNKNIEQAVTLISTFVRVEKMSSIIETDPVGGPPQGKFLNAVLKGTTDLSPEELLERTQAIEKLLGRIRTLVNGPRTIDIDILLFGSAIVMTQQLTIPHPRMLERKFVLDPLKEIEPQLTEHFLAEKYPQSFSSVYQAP